MNKSGLQTEPWKTLKRISFQGLEEEPTFLLILRFNSGLPFFSWKVVNHAHGILQLTIHD